MVVDTCCRSQEKAQVEKAIKGKLKAIMMTVDLEEVTSVYVRVSSHSPSSSPPSLLLQLHIPPGVGTLDTPKCWNSPCAIFGVTTCHEMRHSLSLPTVTYICMKELPHFHHGPTSSFLYSQPIQTPPSEPGLICAAGQLFICDDPSVTPLG